jgi:hypothetical protein
LGVAGRGRLIVVAKSLPAEITEQTDYGDQQDQTKGSRLRHIGSWVQK